jgi:5-methylcytosine-specific restriction endonuclease McrA
MSNQDYPTIAPSSTRPLTVNTFITAEYLAYLESPEWHKKRTRAILIAGRKCQLCSATTGLEVHHNTYFHLYHEPMVDLVCLCSRCHDVADARRQGRRVLIGG